MNYIFWKKLNTQNARKYVLNILRCKSWWTLVHQQQQLNFGGQLIKTSRNWATTPPALNSKNTCQMWKCIVHTWLGSTHNHHW